MTIATLLFLYFGARLGVFTGRLILSYYKDEVISNKDIFKETSQYVWKVIRANILLGLMLFIPLRVIQFYLPLESDYFTFIAIFIPPVLLSIAAYFIIRILFGYGPFVRIIFPEVRHYFKFNRVLVSKGIGLVFKVILINLIPVILLASFEEPIKYTRVLQSSDYLILGIIAIFRMILLPFQYSLVIGTILELYDRLDFGVKEAFFGPNLSLPSEDEI